MARKRGSRRRGGWRQKGHALQAYVRLHAGAGGLRTRTYPLGTAAADMQEWIDDEVSEYRRRHPRAPVGTLAADAATYLKSLVNRPRLQKDRAFQLAWWCDRFGARSRWSLKPIELETALNELSAAGAAASTVKKYRTALYHLFTKLDGRNAPNPLRDVKPPREPEPLPRAIAYSLIESVLAAIPNDRFSRGLAPEQVTAIRRALNAPRPNYCAIATTHHVSETMVRKIRDGVRRRSARSPSESKAGLRLMATQGWSPAMIRAFRPEDYDAASRSVLARGRSKGAGSRALRQPVTAEAAAAFEHWIAIGAPTDINTTSWLRMWRRGVERFCAALEQDEATRALGEKLRGELADVTPYALRHSFLTDVQLATGNIHTTQSYALHVDARMTRRYTLAAVAPELQAAAALLAAHRGGQRPGNEPSGATSENLQKPKVSDGARETISPAKTLTKGRKHAKR